MTHRQNKHTIQVIGAGPYGLSIAATSGVEFRIFGVQCSRWRAYIPKLMFLNQKDVLRISSIAPDGYPLSNTAPISSCLCTIHYEGNRRGPDATTLFHF